MPNKKKAITKKEREGDGSKWNRESYEREITLAQLAGAMMQQVKEPKPRNTNDRVDGKKIRKKSAPMGVCRYEGATMRYSKGESSAWRTTWSGVERGHKNG